MKCNKLTSNATEFNRIEADAGAAYAYVIECETNFNDSKWIFAFFPQSQIPDPGIRMAHKILHHAGKHVDWIASLRALHVSKRKEAQNRIQKVRRMPGPNIAISVNEINALELLFRPLRKYKNSSWLAKLAFYESRCKPMKIIKNQRKSIKIYENL